MGTRSPMGRGTTDTFNPTLTINGGTVDQRCGSAPACLRPSHTEPLFDGEATRSMEERYGIREEGMF